MGAEMKRRKKKQAVRQRRRAAHAGCAAPALDSIFFTHGRNLDYIKVSLETLGSALEFKIKYCG